jgi:hypothetical protein
MFVVVTELPELPEPKANPALPVRKANPARPELKAPRAPPAPRALMARQAQMAPLDDAARPERPALKARPALRGQKGLKVDLETTKRMRLERIVRGFIILDRASSSCRSASARRLPCSYSEILARDAKPAHHGVQRRSRQSEAGGRGADHAAAFPQRPDDMFPLHMLERGAAGGFRSLLPYFV